MEVIKSSSFYSYLHRYEYVLKTVPERYQYHLALFTFENSVPIQIASRLFYQESQWIATAVGRPNKNGTRDYGISQLNSQYLTFFITNFYTRSEKFNVFNGVHNMEIGVKYLRYLYDETGSWELAVMSYNCGIGNVQNGTIPESTRRYAKRILY